MFRILVKLPNQLFYVAKQHSKIGHKHLELPSDSLTSIVWGPFVAGLDYLEGTCWLNLA